MKSILILFFVLLQFSLYAQQSNNSHHRSAGDAYRVVNYNQQVQVKEAELSQLLEKYGSAHESLKPVLIKEVHTLLYELFDINIKYREEEARILGDKIMGMESDEAFSDRSEEIRQYKIRLQKVESTLDFRRENRERIVNQRMAEILR